jgi:NADH-quinone oxidoreductase subunit L
MVLEAAWASGSGAGHYAFWLGVIAALLTAFYSWRLLLMTFHGKPRADHHTMSHVHESPYSMLIPMMFLAVGAIFAGWGLYDYFVGEGMHEFWGKAIFIADNHHALHDAHHVPAWVKLAPLVVAILGIAAAYWAYLVRPGIPGAMAREMRGLYLFLLNKWYFDELYDFLFVRPAKRIGAFLWKRGDGTVIDGFGPNGIAAGTVILARRAGRLQTGYVYHYAFAMLIGVAAFVSWYLFERG